jgi:hypothetical protein
MKTTNQQFYACIDETLGSHGKHIFRDLKTKRGVINRMLSYKYEHFSIYTFVNFYDDKSFKLVYKQ